MLASAAEIPEELLDHVLDHLGRDASLRMIEPDQRIQAKHSLSQCSLVCRFWSSRCRPRIFYNLTLRSLEDAQTILGFPRGVRQHVVDLFLEETESCEPWTHMVYRAAIDGELSPGYLAHQLNGACTPVSVQTLRSLHPSLPMRTPITFREDIFLHIKNYRLRAITDIAHFMRTLWESTGWQIQLTNVSWVKSPQAVPRTIGMRNRATCDNLDIRQCAERWPFVWLCISTRTPEPGSVTPVPYLTLDEAFRLGAFVRCLTVPAGLQGRPYCACTTIHRNGPLKHRSNNAFALQLNCVEKSWICMPWTRIACEGGHISEFMITFNTDPAIGCMPSDFDWDEFDELASHCHGLAQVVMRLDGDLAYVTHFAEDMGRRLRRLRATQRLVIFYEGTEDDDQAWHTWEWRD